MRALGDQYVKDEFRRHKQVNPAEAHVYARMDSKYPCISFPFSIYVLDLKNVLNEYIYTKIHYYLLINAGNQSSTVNFI